MRSAYRLLTRIIQFALVANRQDLNLILGGQEPVKCDVPGLAKRDHQFTQILHDASSNQWMVRKGLNGLADGVCRSLCYLRINFGQKSERALKVGKRVTRIDYPRQGLGRAALGFRAKRSSQT